MSKSFYLLIVLVCLIMLAVIFFNFLVAQEKKEYPDSKSREFWYNKDLPFPEINTLKLSGDKVDQDSVWIPPERRLNIYLEKNNQDSVLVLFSTRGLLGLLKEYKSYSDTVTIYVKHWSLTDYGDTLEVVSVPQRGTFMSVEGLMDWLENVKLKEIGMSSNVSNK